MSLFSFSYVIIKTEHLSVISYKSLFLPQIDILGLATEKNYYWISFDNLFFPTINKTFFVKVSLAHSPPRFGLHITLGFSHVFSGKILNNGRR